MIVLVCGGRAYSNWPRLRDTLDLWHSRVCFTKLIEGDAPGADKLAGTWAMMRGVPCRHYPADWDRYGLSAGSRRNRYMLRCERVDLVIAFPGDTGTADMREIAAAHDIPVIRVIDAPVSTS